MAQFFLFLFLGVLLYVFYQGAVQPSDEVLPRFIVEGLPAGVSGIIIAGVFAAAMSTLSGSLNSLASASMLDIYKPRWGKNNTQQKDLLISRLLTVFWGIIFIGGAMLFQDKNNPVVELGLAIASFTYGGLLGAFFLGSYCKKATEDDALVALWGAIFFMTWIIGQQGMVRLVLAVVNSLAGIMLWFKLRKSVNRLFVILWSVLMLALLLGSTTPHIAWPWYVLIGSSVSLLIGVGLSRIRPDHPDKT